MRKSMLLTAAVAMCLIWTTANATGQGKKKAGAGGFPSGGFPHGLISQEPGAIFDLLAKGRGFFLVTETRSLRDALTQYAKAKGITNGQINREQFMEFHAHYANKAAAGQPGGAGGGAPGLPAGGFGGIAPRLKTWEYRVLTRGFLTKSGKQNLEAGLNQAGAEGWELIVSDTSPSSWLEHSFIFRRPGATKPRAAVEPAAAPAPAPAPKQKAEEPPVFRIFRLKHADAADVANLLGELLRGSKDGLRIVADQHGNQLLLRGPAQAHVEIDEIMRVLDVPRSRLGY